MVRSADTPLGTTNRSLLQQFVPVILVSVICWGWIAVGIDPGGSYPSMSEGPGLTIDEVFNVSQGVYLVEQCKHLGWLNLVPGTSLEAYKVENGYLADHPPLGRLWLGIHHLLTWTIAPPLEPDGPFVTACARVGSATAFALTVLLIGWTATVWYGSRAGLMSAVALTLMPRVFGHAHLASLETITNLTCTAAVLCIAGFWTGPKLPSRTVAAFSGLMLGFALLTKIQAVLIPIPVIVCMLWKWRAQAIVPLLIWAVTATVVFFAGWPYLWFDSVDHLFEYLGRTTNRATLQVWYFGTKYPDKLVPWHYPFVYFGLTIPVLLQVFGLAGLIRSFARRNEEGSNLSRDVLLLACLVFPLIVFAIPRIAVYDCERLFLTSFPLWAIFVGRGWAAFREAIGRWSMKLWIKLVISSAIWVWALLPIVMWNPCHLCYYNEATSLMGGADKAGLEIDYWGAGVTRGLFRRMGEAIPDNSTIAVIPTLHQLQAKDYLRQSPLLRSRSFKIVEFGNSEEKPRFLIVFRRRADLPAEWDSIDEVNVRAKTIMNGSVVAYVTFLKE